MGSVIWERRLSSLVIQFLEDDGTFVAANLRGGKEYGEEWHRKVMREMKQNVFDDFIACGRGIPEQNEQRKY
ncbi:S9 family peptidase [Candidatus Bathyarchaeota archaeon]|nr:S9 family peptidase [Candidatus Bathyarchaeota archaeon]